MRASAVESRPWVGFLVGSVRLAVDAAQVRGIAWNRDLVPVPFALSTVAGILVRGGRVVPVFDFGRVAGAWNRMPGPGGSQVVVLSEGEMEAGILAEGAETFRAGRPGPGPGAPADVREAILSGVLEREGGFYGVLDVPAALHAAGVPKTFSG